MSRGGYELDCLKCRMLKKAAHNPFAALYQESGPRHGFERPVPSMIAHQHKVAARHRVDELGASGTGIAQRQQRSEHIDCHY
jgi:hypothetical protein